MRKLQEVKEELGSSSDDEDGELRPTVTRLYIDNEELMQEEDEFMEEH
jgi:hypothetical protein